LIEAKYNQELDKKQKKLLDSIKIKKKTMLTAEKNMQQQKLKRSS
jgi:hypothetical protein